MRPFAPLAAVSLLGALLVAPAAVAAPPTAAAAPFLVGAARVTTDPPEPYDGSVCIGGYGSFCERSMKRVEDPTFARAVAVTGDRGKGGTAIVVTTTSIGLFAAYKPENGGGNGSYDIRQEVAARIPVPAESVVIQADHSHAGADTIGLWGGVPVSYLERQRKAVVDAAVAAYRARVPASFQVASVIGPPTASSYSTGPNAGRDDEFRLLVADDVRGKRLLTFSNYSPHATVLGSSNKDGTSGDWTSWASQEAEKAFGGFGVGAIGSIGSTDWNKVEGDAQAKEAEARQRLRALMRAATKALKPVTGSMVAVQSTFIREPLTQPVLGANFVPGIVGLAGQGELRIDRAVLPPWNTGTVVGTYAGALRIGDVFTALAPGEVFPKINDLLRQGGVQAQDHLFLGAVGDFLGYMVDGEDAYLQALQQGATFLAGCPEDDLGGDPACNDHVTLMVSPTIGTHVLCTIQDAADAIGFVTGPRNPRCAALTALDGVAAPAEVVPPGGPSEPPPSGGGSGPGSGSGPGEAAGGAVPRSGSELLAATGPVAPTAVVALAAGLLVAGCALRRRPGRT